MSAPTFDLPKMATTAVGHARCVNRYANPSDDGSEVPPAEYALAHARQLLTVAQGMVDHLQGEVG